MAMTYLEWATVVLIGITIGVICWMVWNRSKDEREDQPNHMDDEEMAEVWREFMRDDSDNDNDGRQS